MVEARGRYVDGRFTAAERATAVIEVRASADPVDLVGQFPIGADDVDRALSAALAAAPKWATLDIESRLAALNNIETPLAKRSPELLALLQRELGRPAWECERELSGLLGRLRGMIENGASLVGDTRATAMARVAHRPLGVVVVLGPVMPPLGISHTQILAALVAGNTVVWKPSPLCAASAQLYAEILDGASLPPGIFNMVQGDADVGRALVQDARVDGVVFIGSEAHGDEVRARCRPGVKLVQNLGAKNPAVVLDDAELPWAAREIAESAFITAGQRCMSLSRVLVHRHVADRFCGLLVDETLKLKVGGPEAFTGPLFTQARLDRFVARTAELTATGVRTLLGGERRPPGWFLTPSVRLVEDPQAARTYLDEELFGPDLAVEVVDDLDAAIARCNHGSHGLCASLFSVSNRRWDHFSRHLVAGALLHNRGPHTASGRLSIGGLKASGSGDLNGLDAIAALQRRVALFDRHDGLTNGDPAIRTILMTNGSRPVMMSGLLHW